MPSLLSTEGLARAASRHPWRTIAAWLLVLVVSFGLIAVFLGDALTSESDVTNNPESKQASDLIFERLAHEPEPSEIVVLRSDRYTVDDPEFEATAQSLLDRGRETGVVTDAQSFFTSGDDSLVSEDRHATAVPILLRTEDLNPLVDVVDEADGGGFDVSITGSITSDADFEKLSEEDLQKGELLIGLPAALIILVLVFGAVVAGLIPVLLALLAIVVAVALTALVGQIFELSFFVVNMISGMGLALGIDYSLFILSRYREERVQGREKLDAIAAAGATASRAVLFSGIAFVLAMIGMVLVPDTILRSLATGAILVGIVSVLAALTLLPAVLSLLGDRVNSLRIPIVGRSAESAGAEGRFWSAVVKRVMRRPVVSLLVAGGLLLAAAVPILDMNTGFAGISTLPDRFPSKQGFTALSEEFPQSGTNPVEIVVDGDVESPAVQRGIERLQESLAENPIFGRATIETNDAGDLARFMVPVTDSSSSEAYDAVRSLRSADIPAAFAGTDARGLVAGESAENVDYFELIGSWLPIVFAFVLGLSFILLTIAFRSVVVPALAIVLNLLSVGAAYGLLVLAFQKGVGNEIFGFQQVDAIEAWVPLFLFSVLFGLSMDYQVFLLSRIRERFTATRDPAGAVAFGVGSTARIITGAALIIVAVFAGFAAGDLVMFQQMGFGVAIALLLDATIVRSVLVPAAMKLLGDWNWYFPSWLEWVPELQVEGHEPAPSSQPVTS
ncbi:MAG TPA: MMPL family transporter [Gaiellaceae bacterium]|nr:MMPL family transporter [Gaiellaceae bacterium]